MNQEVTDQESERCRLVLVVPPLEDAAERVRDALSGGDVASLILMRGEMDETRYTAHCKRVCEAAQPLDVAVLAVDDTQALGRSGADGLFVTQPGNEYKDVVARFSPQKIVGFGGARDRHRALEIGEAYPDFLFFGKLDGDIKPQAHSKNLALAEWWSKIVEIPCIVMGGSALESVVECQASGAEFVALGLAVFAHTDGAGEAVREANRLIDENAAYLSL